MTLAQLINPVIPETIGSGKIDKGGEATGLLLSNLIGGMFIVGFIIAFLYLMTGALHWITSAGDKASLESARNKIIHAIVGLIILASTWAIMLLVGDFLGLNFRDLTFPSISNTVSTSGGSSGGLQ